jgi:hypothetical protein
MRCTYEVLSRSTGLISNRKLKSMEHQNILTLLMRPLTLFRMCKLAQAVTRLNCTCQVISSKPGRNTDYSDCVFLGCSQFLQANAGIVPQIRPQQPYSVSFAINYLLIDCSVLHILSGWHSHQINHIQIKEPACTG